MGWGGRLPPPFLSSLEEREGGRRRRERERQNEAKGVVRLSRFGDPPTLGTFCRIEVGQGFEPARAEYGLELWTEAGCGMGEEI